VALNAILLVIAGLLFHRLSRRSYPHRPPGPVNRHDTTDEPPQLRSGVRRSDVDAALGSLHETYDIEEADLVRLIGEIERQALLRARGGETCAGIMSRDVVKADLAMPPAEALALLLHHNIRTLPVVDAEGRLLGTVGLRELASAPADLAEALSPAQSARPEDAVVSLLPLVSDGLAHAVVITDAERRVVGLVTQTDLLAALGHMLATPRLTPA
jgi:CBS domain-containing membrane protein